MASPFPYRPDFLQVDYEVKSNEASNVGSLFLAVHCRFLVPGNTQKILTEI